MFETMSNWVVFAATDKLHFPEYATDWAAGWDLRCSKDTVIKPHETVRIPSWLKIKLPKGFVFIIKPRSSLAVKRNVLIVEGTIDSDYRGEISIVAHNLWDETVFIPADERIAQGIIMHLPEMEFRYSMNYDRFADEYPTERWEGWFGSTWSF